ncbi:CPBP family intramembrane metalloprotease [Candidatus Haliotispira prima]|uniref:CPBP family intramembrane metalloprotease n=1 Tax=Candidatus Haliotispira prima TaxID=3034016 RepID=A0ABY8MJC3_9SPIO|nr:CPBP family intramembrane metalloprotease [Candidatus Haliotispira prima]
MFTVGFAEELFMHSLAIGLMILAWGESRKTVLKAAIIGSLIFGVAHIIAVISNPAPGFILFKSTIMIMAILLSMCFAGLVYQINSVWVAVLLHGLLDVIAGWMGSPEILDMLNPSEWTLKLSFWVLLYALPWGIYGYWLLIKDFKKQKDAHN